METRLYAVPVCLSLGIALYFAWPHEPSLFHPVLIAALFLTLASWVRGQGDGLTVHRLALLAGFWITFGFGAASFRAQMVQTPILNAPIGPVWVEGTIASFEQLEGGKGALLIIDDPVTRDLSPTQTPRAFRLTVRKGTDQLAVGARIGMMAKIEPPSNPTTPGGFDFRRDAYFKQIGGYGYVLGTPKIVAAPQLTGYTHLFENLRNTISARVAVVLPAGESSMVTALLTGERAAINDADWQALRDSGLAHLLAISGANVDMVALVVFFVARFLMAAVPAFAVRHPIKKYAAVLAFLAALAYVLLILPSIPTWRALLTIAIVLTAVVLDRSPISLRLVCTVAAIVLVALPEQLLSPSFQLSFAAVTALVAVFEWLTPWLKTRHQQAGFVGRTIMYVVGVGGTTVIATIATAPISLYHFQTLALYGVLANALAVPIMTFIIMPVALLTYLVMPFGLDAPLLHIMGQASDGVLNIAHWTAHLPGARLAPPAMPFAAFIMIVVAGVMLCLMARALKTLVLVPCMIAVVIIAVYEQPHAMIAKGGKLMMVRNDDGTITANTRRAERRLQGDWAQYWGVDPKAITIGAVDLRQNIKNTSQLYDIYAIYNNGVEPVRGRGTGRLWQKTSF